MSRKPIEISYETWQNIQRRFAAGQSIRTISDATGISRNIVTEIKYGKRQYDRPENTQITPPRGKYASCPTCGAKVKMPCLRCQVEIVQAEQKERRKKTALPASWRAEFEAKVGIFVQKVLARELEAARAVKREMEETRDFGKEKPKKP